MRRIGYNHSAVSYSGRRGAAHWPMLTALAMSLALAACGGGGGGDTAPPAGNDGDPPSGVDASDPFAGGPNAFRVDVASALTSAQALDAVAGGQRRFASWNPVGGDMLKPGLKVNFFGRAPSCETGVANGPVQELPAAPEDAWRRAVALGEGGDGFVADWQPSGQTAACASEARDAQGPGRVVLDARAGAVGLYTASAAKAGAGEPLMLPYDAAGQDGKGTNAFNTSSFVTFRMDWRQTPQRPWLSNALPGQAGVARIHTRQAIGTLVANAPTGHTQPVQSKQFLAVGFINNACAAGGMSASRPCQVKYLFPLAIAQAGISDWSRVGWFTSGRVWFDPVQGGMPIVEGAPPARGEALHDVETGAALFTSAGSPARHGAFADKAFDMRISFDQLRTVLRIVAGRQAKVPASQVTPEQLAATWGSAWADPAQWSLLTVAVAQEVHNPYADGEARAGGAFSALYVGPQD